MSAQKSVRFHISREFAQRAPAEVVRKVAAEHAGDLLTQMLLDPEADPFSRLLLRAEYRDDPYYDAVEVHVWLMCDSTPEPPEKPPRTIQGPRSSLERVTYE